MNLKILLQEEKNQERYINNSISSVLEEKLIIHRRYRLFQKPTHPIGKIFSVIKEREQSKA
jgi:hypothetical protein